ncbi:MAG: DUF4384 domain-containing protein, partial [Pseudomonadota bacterium]
PNPSDRPADMNAILSQIGNTRPDRARRAVKASPRRKKSNSGRAILLALVGLGLVGGAGYAGYVFMSSPAQLIDTDMLETPQLPDGMTMDGAMMDGELETPSGDELQTGIGQDLDTALLSEVINNTPCAALEASVSDDGVVSLRGDVASAETQLGLAERIQNVPGVTGLLDETLITPQPVCEAVALVHPWAQPGLLPTQFNTEGQVYRDGDYLVIMVSNSTGLAKHVSVDFFDPSGEVYHLRPNPLQTETWLEADAVAQIGVGPEDVGPTVRHYRLGAPFGQATVIVTATDEPLFADERPEAELASDYLDALRVALDSQAQGAIVTNWQAIDIVQ